MVYTVFFCIAMIAFVTRHHGETIPKCKEANSTHEADALKTSAEALTAAILGTPGIFALSTNESENGVTGLPGIHGASNIVNDIAIHSLILFKLIPYLLFN